MKKRSGRQSSPEEMGGKIPVGKDWNGFVRANTLKVSQKSYEGGGARGNFFESPPTRKATSRLRLLGVAR